VKRAGLILALILWTGNAAAAEKTKVVVTEVKGSIAFMVEGAIKNALKKQKSVEIVSSAVWRGSPEKSGVKVLIDATTQRDGAKWAASIRVSSASGTLVKTWKVKAKEIKKLSAGIQKKLWKALGPSIAKAASMGGPAIAAAEEPEPEPEKAPEPEKVAEPEKTPEPEKEPPPPPVAKVDKVDKAEKTEKAEKPKPKEERRALIDSGSKREEPKPALARESTGPHTRSTTPLSATLAFDFFTRTLRYNDDLFGALRPYTLSGAPAPRLDVVWYPGAHVTTGIAAHLGVALSAEYALALKSKDSMNREFPTSSIELEGALRGRLPLGEHEVAIFAGAGTHTFRIQDAGGVDPDIPEVSYTFLQAGLEARFAIFDPLNLTLRGAYRPVLSAGEIESEGWFSRASAGAVDLGLAVAWELLPSLDLIAGAQMRRYFYSMNPEPGDPRVAGGAVDQYFSGTLAIGWHLR
jgi:outer membrane biosynthesis protein TonB